MPDFPILPVENDAKKGQTQQDNQKWISKTSRLLSEFEDEEEQEEEQEKRGPNTIGNQHEQG